MDTLKLVQIAHDILYIKGAEGIDVLTKTDAFIIMPEITKGKGITHLRAIPSISCHFRLKCGKGDSNSHARYRRYHLKVVRLPISPSPQLIFDGRQR
ncbi:MAG: hypothetical protein JWQ38_280 [Flavipsychrobacter sp.]|nr:hypothetical protein [Flavipsychrobacter sp.]